MTTTTALRCEATTGVARGDWGFERQRCHASRGLRSFIDAEGLTHYACPALGHMADVVRRFGEARKGTARVPGGMTEAEHRLTVRLTPTSGRSPEARLRIRSRRPWRARCSRRESDEPA